MVQLLISNIIIYQIITHKAKPIVIQSFVWIVLLCGILYQNNANCQNIDSTANAIDTFKTLNDSAKFSIDTLKTKKEGGLESIVNYSADDSIRFDLPNKLVYLYGNAKLLYEDMDLRADYMVIDFGKKTLSAKGTYDSLGNVKGRPKFKTKNQEVVTDSVLYSFEQKRGRLRGVVMQEGEGFIHMDKVYRNEAGHIFSNAGRYTTCSHEHPHFYIKARKLKLVPNDKIVFGPSNLYIEDVPTPLILPFGIFPTKDGRKSGIIFPEIGTEVVRGANVRNLGYYFGINDNMDFLLSGDFFFRGSWALRAKSRYVKKYKHNGNIEISYGRTIIGEKEDETYEVSPDFRVYWRHNQDSKKRPGTTFNANIDVQSSNYNRYQTTETQTILQNELSSSINYGKVFGKGKYNLNVNAGHRQNTATRDITVTFPSVNFGVARFNPFARKESLGTKKWYEKIGVSYNTSYENKVSTLDTILFQGRAWDEFQMGMSHSIPVSTTIKAGYFTLAPSFNYNEYWYIETLNRSYDNVNDTIIDNDVQGFDRAYSYNMGMNINTRIFGMYEFRKSKKLVALRQVITPTVGFTYRPDFSDQKYGFYDRYETNILDSFGYYSRFEGAIKGGPSSGESGSLNFGINNNFELKTKHSSDTGVSYKYIKVLENLSASGSYNFLADSLKLSDIAINARTTLFKKLNISGRLNYDPYARDTFGRNINQFEWDKNGRIARLTDAQILFNVSLSPDDFKKGKKESKYYRPLPYYYYYNVNFVDFNVPWTVNFDYNLQFLPEAENQLEQTLGFNGDIKLTENWKIGYTSGYSIDKKQWALTKFDIHRSLHCWQFSFSWIPTGFYQSFTFSIQPKSTQLQALKLNKRKSYQDLNAEF